MAITTNKLSMFLHLAILVYLPFSFISLANAGTQSELAALYENFLQKQELSVFGESIFVSSNVQANRYSASAYGIVEHSFSEVSKELSIHAKWCQFVTLNFNVKACTYHTQDNQQSLTFYAGRKFYQPPKKAYKLHYQFKITDRSDSYVRIVLKANTGPMETKDYRIELDAIPVGNRTFLRFRSSYQSSFISKLATEVYLTTIARDKLGFSVVGTTETGEPVFVSGLEGIVERNAMRYYIALKVFLDTLKLPSNDRFEVRIRDWFDICETYATQLHELERDEYLASKRLERRNQIKLQRALSNRFNK